MNGRRGGQLRRSKSRRRGRIRERGASLVRELRIFAHRRDWDQFHSPKKLAMALAGESGELLEVFQSLTEGQSSNLPDSARTAATEEIGDIQICLLRLADPLGIDQINAAEEKLVVNGQKCSVHKSRGHARKYAEMGL